MPELSLYNIDIISRDVRELGITFSHLPDDLIDHICCDVEEEMLRGLNFSEAYSRVKKRMGHRRLNEIQEETLYAVDTKYRKMKNLMKISGVAGTIMLGFAALFKIMHWPGSSILLTLGGITLAFLFLPSALIVLWKESRSPQRLFLYLSAFAGGFFFILGVVSKVMHWPGAFLALLISIISGIFFFIPALTAARFSDPENRQKRFVFIAGAAGTILYLFGLLCKIQHWPWATAFSASGVILIGFIALPWYTYATWKEENSIRPAFLYLVIGLLIIMIPGTLVNLNLQAANNDLYYENLSHQQKMQVYFSERNQDILETYSDSLCSSGMDKVHQRTLELTGFITDIQMKMVEITEGAPDNLKDISRLISKSGNVSLIDYPALSAPFNKYVVGIYLLPGSDTRQKLESLVADYRSFISAEVPQSDSVKLAQLTDPSSFLPGSQEGNGQLTMLTGMHSLELMKNSVLVSESGILKSLAGSR